MSRRSTCARRSGRLRAPLVAGAAGLALALAPGAALAVPSATVEIADVLDRPLATADTVDPGSMTVTNTSTAGEKIVSFTIDLTRGSREPPSAVDCDLVRNGGLCEGPAILPGLAFDPNGGAGDAAGKALTLDSSTEATGFAAAPAYAEPVGAGFGAVTATFPVDVQPNDAPNDFDDGDSATFSFDVDPTSVQGATTAPAAAVAPSELQGAWVTMTFSDGTTLHNDLSLVPGSETDVRSVLALTTVEQDFPAFVSRPFGQAAEAETPHAEQTVIVSGSTNPAGGVLIVARGGLDLTGAPPGDGERPGPLVANTLTDVREIPFALEDGVAAIPVTLAPGINVITAYFPDGPGPGPVSPPLVLRLDEGIETDPPTVVSIEPATTAAQANRDGVVRVVFSEPIDVGTVSGPYPHLWPYGSGIRITPGASGEWTDPDFTPIATVPVPDEGSGGTGFTLVHRDVMVGRPRPPIPFGPGEYTVTVRPNVFDVHGNRLIEEVSTTFTVVADSPREPEPPVQPPPGSHQETPRPAPTAAPGDPVCVPVPPRPARRESDTIRLNAAQLLISQRIAQAAVRRANAVEAWLKAGIVAGDLCGNAFGPAEFAGVTWAGGASNPPVSPTPRPIVAEPAAESAAEARSVTLSAAQLLINQRISQAAVRRVDALIDRLNAGLTGGDLADGSLGAGALWAGLRARSSTAAAPAASSRTVIGGREGGGGRVSVSVAQLRINQRISQAAVRRVNALIDRLQRGLTGAEFRDGSLTAADLAPGARP